MENVTFQDSRSQRGIYYKHDYSEGVDISRYKNIPVPTSYMAEKE